MSYETLTLDQFDAELRKSDFKVSQEEVTAIRTRAYSKLINATVELAIRELVSSIGYQSEGKSKAISAMRMLSKALVQSELSNVIPKSHEERKFYTFDPKISKHDIRHENYFDEAA